MNRFSIWSAVIAFVVTLLLGGLDYYYYHQSASGQSIEDLQHTEDSMKTLLLRQQQHIEKLIRQNEELSKLFPIKENKASEKTRPQPRSYE